MFSNWCCTKTVGFTKLSASIRNQDLPCWVARGTYQFELGWIVLLRRQTVHWDRQLLSLGGWWVRASLSGKLGLRTRGVQVTCVVRTFYLYFVHDSHDQAAELWIIYIHIYRPNLSPYSRRARMATLRKCFTVIHNFNLRCKLRLNHTHEYDPN